MCTMDMNCVQKMLFTNLSRSLVDVYIHIHASEMTRVKIILNLISACMTILTVSCIRFVDDNDDEEEVKINKFIYSAYHNFFFVSPFLCSSTTKV